MIAGILNEVVDILQQKTIKNQYGEEFITWETLIHTRAGVSWSTGNLTTDAEEVVVHYVITFTLRYYHNIDETMRIKWKNKLYRITSIVPDRYRQRLLISTELVNE